MYHQQKFARVYSPKHPPNIPLRSLSRKAHPSFWRPHRRRCNLPLPAAHLKGHWRYPAALLKACLLPYSVSAFCSCKLRTVPEHFCIPAAAYLLTFRNISKSPSPNWQNESLILYPCKIRKSMIFFIHIRNIRRF